jgi:hypothetical protein
MAIQAVLPASTVSTLPEKLRPAITDMLKQRAIPAHDLRQKSGLAVRRKPEIRHALATR